MKDRIITQHANERYYDRTNQEVTRKKIVTHITNGGQILYAKRLTATRSLAYIPIGSEVFKVIINRKSKVIVSILPFNDHFIRKIKVFSGYYDDKTYLIEMYPDCYNETRMPHALTKIYEINGDELIDINFNHPFFNGIFKAAWKIHLGIKGLQKDEEIAIESQTTTVDLTQFCQAQANC